MTVTVDRHDGAMTEQQLERPDDDNRQVYRDARILSEIEVVASRNPAKIGKRIVSGTSTGGR
jgi:hypothetical protein